MPIPDQLTPAAVRPSPVRLESAHWSSGPTVVLTTRDDRRIGLRPLPGPFWVLLRTRSIHTFGMRIPIGVVALTSDWMVIRAAAVPPRRLFIARTARWILEVAPTPLPQVGTRLLILDS
jgi:hypothetical protein